MWSKLFIYSSGGLGATLLTEQRLCMPLVLQSAWRSRLGGLRVDNGKWLADKVHTGGGGEGAA